MSKKNFAGLRQGVTVVELAVVSTATFMLIIILIVGGMGVFRYHLVAHLAREGARYASTHGGQYDQDGIDTQTSVAAITSSDNMRTYLLNKAVSLDTSKLTITASWSSPSTVSPRNIPTYMDTNTALVPPGQVTIQNYVTVTVSYQWFPELYLAGPFTLTSSSTMPMSY